MAAHRRSGTGWIVVSGILLLLAGGNIFLNGLFALHANNTVQNNVHGTLLFSDTNLDTWGWIYAIVGGIIVLVALGVFFRAQWAVMLGIVAAMFGAFMSFFWLFTPYWPDALISILLNGIVIYGLGAHGLEDATMAA
jgi:hypothetical protein